VGGRRRHRSARSAAAKIYAAAIAALLIAGNTAWGSAPARPTSSVASVAASTSVGTVAAAEDPLAPLGDVSRRAAFSTQRRQAGAVDQAARRNALVGALGVGAEGDLRLRAGGGGVLTVSLQRQVDRPVPIGDASVELAVPRQYRPDAVSALGWACSRRDQTVSCRATAPAVRGTLGVIAVGLRAQGSGPASIDIRASWRQGARRYTSADTARFRVRRPMTVRATSAAGTVLSPVSGVGAAPILLSARLGRSAAGLPVAYRWRQLCRRPGCRRVTWLTVTAGRASGPVITAQARVPAVRRATRLRFAVIARSWRGAASSITTVTVRPQSTVALPSPRRIRTRGLAPTRTSGYMTRHAVTRGLELAGSALQGPRAGQLARLRAVAQGGRLSAPRWTELRGPRGLLTGRAIRLASLVFRAPRRPGMLVLRVRATVSGQPVSDTATIHVTPGPIRARARARGADETSGPFCGLWTAASAGDPSAGTGAAPVHLPDGSDIALGNAIVSGRGCDGPGAAVSFTAGSLTAGAARFTDVAGAVTASGVELSSGWLERPAGWTDLLPKRIRVEPGAEGAWGADLTASGWGALRARIDLDDGIELLPLPAGWTFPLDQSTFTYEPLTGAFAVRSLARAPADQSGEVTLDGSYQADGTTAVSVTAEDVAVLNGVGRDAVGLSGQGSVSATPGPDGVKLTGSVQLSSGRDAAIALAAGLLLSNATASWDAAGISVAGEVLVQTKREPFRAKVSGAFVSSSQWKLEVTQADAATLVDGVTLTGVHGLIERAPAEPVAGEGGDDPGADMFSVDLAGSVIGWSPSPQLSDVHVDGHLTNICPEPADGCQTSAVRLAMAVTGRALVLDQTVAWEGEASLNLSTFALRFSAGARIASFGPGALSLSDVQLRLSNQGAQWCRVTGEASPLSATSPPTTPAASFDSDQELSFSVTGNGRILGQRFSAMAELTSAGYCIAGTFGDFDPEGLPSGAGQRSLIDNARLLYATRDAQVTLAGRTVAVTANQLRVTGELNFAPDELPQRLRNVLGGRNELALTIARSDGAFTLDGTATFSFAQPVYLIGDAAHAQEARLRVTSAQLAFALGSSDSLRLGLAAHGALLTPANPSKNIAASSTPLFVAAGVNLGTPSITISAGVDTNDPAVANGTVTNAFGQPGLDVRKLVVAASLGASTSFGISADATLPQSWTNSLGMSTGVPARLAFSISQTAPCLDIALGAPPPADGGTSQAPAILRLGALSASYAQIVVAPTGCRIGGAAPGTPETKIEPGFGLGFDGQVGAAPVTFVAAMRLAHQAFALQTKVRIGALDAGSVHFRHSTLDLDIDTAATTRHVDVGFSGGLDVGESTIDVDGHFTATGDSVTASLRGQGRLRLAGLTFAEGTIDAALRFQRQANGTWTAQSAGVTAQTTVLGTSVGLIFSYRDGNLATAAGAWEYHAGLGPAALNAGVLFAYAPDGVSLNGERGCNIGQLATHGDRQLLLRLCGAINVGPLRRELNLTVSLPQRFDFDLAIPRSEVGIYLASVHFEGSLGASLQLGLSTPRFWIRDGHARAGGCINMVFWHDCADGINVAFNPPTGRFEGRFLGIPVSWGSDDWRAAPAPAPGEPQPAIGPQDRVFVQPAAYVSVDHRAVSGNVWKRTAYAPSRGLSLPASAVFDPDRHEITMLVPLPADLRAAVPRPALGYLVTFSGVAFDGNQPRSAAAPSGERRIDYTSVSLARVTSTEDRNQNVIVQRAGALTSAADGLSLSWNADSQQPPSLAESGLVADYPQMVQDGLPVGVTLRFSSPEHRAESRQALLRGTD